MLLYELLLLHSNVFPIPSTENPQLYTHNVECKGLLRSVYNISLIFLDGFFVKVCELQIFMWLMGYCLIFLINLFSFYYFFFLLIWPKREESEFRNYWILFCETCDSLLLTKEKNKMVVGKGDVLSSLLFGETSFHFRKFTKETNFPFLFYLG